MKDPFLKWTKPCRRHNFVFQHLVFRDWKEVVKSVKVLPSHELPSSYTGVPRIAILPFVMAQKNALLAKDIKQEKAAILEWCVFWKEQMNHHPNSNELCRRESTPDESLILASTSTSRETLHKKQQRKPPAPRLVPAPIPQSVPDPILPIASLISNRSALDRCPETGDGSCLFRALCRQTYGNADHHLDLRHSIVTYVCDHYNWYGPNLVGYGLKGASQIQLQEAYKKKMSLQKTWGDHVEIQAFADMCNRSIFIWDSKAPKRSTWIQAIHPTTAPGGPVPGPPLSPIVEPVLLLYSGTHYDSLTRRL
jgi:hypothetical protein